MPFYHRYLAIFTLLAIICGTHHAHAVQTSRPLPGDSRFHVITYNPNAVHRYKGFYEYQASILFGEGEEVKTISMGNPSGWQMVPAGQRLFLKPVADYPEDAVTNMLLITNKRTYHFILEAAEATDINDPNLVWQTNFIYPDENAGVVQVNNKNAEPDFSEPGKYNFNYSISGSDFSAPIRIFDDGEFTFFQFPENSANVPAFFLVDKEGREALINYRVEGKYIVIERIASQFTLRHGNEVTCVFNEQRPLGKAIPKKRQSALGILMGK